MSWQEGVAITVVLLGLGAGAFLVAQRPSFWIEFGQRLVKALLPLAWRYVSRRMPPEEEAAWRAAERRGQGDVWLRTRWRNGTADGSRALNWLRFGMKGTASRAGWWPSVNFLDNINIDSASKHFVFGVKIQNLFGHTTKKQVCLSS